MIQDIAPHIFDNSYSPEVKPEKGDTALYFRAGAVLCSPGAEKLLPDYGEYIAPESAVYLFSVDGRRYFLITDENARTEGDYVFTEVKKLRWSKEVSREDIFILFTAMYLWNWYTNNRCCGHCGGKTVPDYSERALLCTRCCRVIYPRINPAVIVGVRSGDELLITRYAENRGYQHDALVAGFTEIGETFEQTVSREVMEEVGLKVKNITYYSSQPWGYTGGILAGFFCDVDGSTEVRLDESELSRAVWVKRQEISGQPDNFSLTNDMMMKFRDGKA